MTDPEPAVVPVKVTEQLVTPDVVDKLQVGELREPHVVPAVSVNVTIPAGALEAVVVSATVAVTEAIQLVPPNAILQLTFPTLVDVLSFDETVTVTVAAELLFVFSAASETYTLSLHDALPILPVKVTEQLVTPDVVDKLQVG